jgi:hypothetical protein
MGTFSPAHWAVALALLSALAVFVWLAGSFILAGLRSDENRRKTVVLLALLPFVALAIYAVVGVASDSQPTARSCPPGTTAAEAFIDDCQL